MRVWFVIHHTVAPGMVIGSFPLVFPKGAGTEDDIREWAQDVFNKWTLAHHYNSKYLDWSVYCHCIDGSDSHESR